MTYEERVALRDGVREFAETVGDGQFGPVHVYDAGEAAIKIQDWDLDLGTTWLLAAFLLHCCNASAEASE